MSVTERPVLETERLRLRPFKAEDAPAVKQMAGDRAIADGTLTIPHPYPEGMAETWIATHAQRFEAGASITFAIEWRERGVLIGAIGLEIDTEHARAELGYWVGRDHWGQGVATEASRALLGYGFGLGLNRIHAAYFVHNPGSGRVLEKIGMTREGLLRGHHRKWGNFVDTVVMGLLREEHEAPGAENPSETP